MSSPRVLPVLLLLAGAPPVPNAAVDAAQAVPIVSWSLTGALGYADVHHLLFADGTYLLVDHGVLALEARVEGDLVGAMLDAIRGSGFPGEWTQELPRPAPTDILVTISVRGGAASYSYLLGTTPKLPEGVATVETVFQRIMNAVLASSSWIGGP